MSTAADDGTKIAYYSNGRVYEIYVMNADGSNRVQLTDSNDINSYGIVSTIGPGSLILAVKGMQSFYRTRNPPTRSITEFGTERVLAPGDRVTLELEKGTYDIRLVDEDSEEYIKRDLQLNSDYTWQVRLSDLST